MHPGTGQLPTCSNASPYWKFCQQIRAFAVSFIHTNVLLQPILTELNELILIKLDLGRGHHQDLLNLVVVSANRIQNWAWADEGAGSAWCKARCMPQSEIDHTTNHCGSECDRYTTRCGVMFAGLACNLRSTRSAANNDGGSAWLKIASSSSVSKPCSERCCASRDLGCNVHEIGRWTASLNQTICEFHAELTELNEIILLKFDLCRRYCQDLLSSASKNGLRVHAIRGEN